MSDELRPLQIRVSEPWLAEIDNWRRKQTKIPSQAEAIRRLVEIGIAAEKRKPSHR